MKILLLGVLLSAMSVAEAKASQIKVGNKCLDVPVAKFENGVQIQLWDCNGTNAQQFEISDSNTETTTTPPTTGNPPPVSVGSCKGVSPWAAGKSFAIGDKVVFESQLFTAAHENPGYNPKVSTWFWTAGAMCSDTTTGTVTPPPVVTPPPTTTPTGDKEIAVYFQSWSAGWTSQGSQHALANLPPYVTTILLAFVRPDLSYASGTNSLGGTGLDFSSDFTVVRDAVKIARSKGQKVILSVGGATYTNWAGFNANAVAAFAKDLGVNGIDIDYEPSGGACSWGTGGNSCPQDTQFIDIIRRARAALPRPLLLTTAGWSTGAFGEGQYASSKMDGRQIGSNFGLYVNPLKQVGDAFDEIFLMAYDAGNTSSTGYDWRKAYAAYSSLFKGRLVIGVESPAEAWGGNVSDNADAAARAQASKGIMLWSWQKPGGVTLAQAACSALGMQGCAQGLPGIPFNPMHAGGGSVMNFLSGEETAKDKRSQFHHRPEKHITMK